MTEANWVAGIVLGLAAAALCLFVFAVVSATRKKINRFRRFR